MLPGDGAAYADKLRQWAGEYAYLIGECTSGNRSYELAMAFTQGNRLDGCYTTDLAEGGARPSTVEDYLKRADPLCAPKWLSTHDQPRHLSHAGAMEESDPVRVARFCSLLMAFLPGCWLIYQGEELGLPQPELSKEETTDPFDLLFWPDGPGREGPRVPLPWNDAPHYGFTAGKPWLPMRWPLRCVPGSRETQAVSAFYREALAVRKRLGWSEGVIESVEADDTTLVVETRAGGQSYLGVFNYDETAMPVPEGTPVLQACRTGALGAYEAMVTRS